MTQETDAVKRMSEFQMLFLRLNEKGQETALALLRSLGFAQSVMCMHGNEPSRNLPGREAV